jgi:hypothetical protein
LEDPSNVGRIDFAWFPRGVPREREVMDTAMAFLEGTDPVIIDLPVLIP